MTPRPAPAAPFMLLLRCHARQALRGLPEGRAAWLRSLVGAGATGAVVAFVMISSYRDLAPMLIHATRTSGAAGHLPSMLGGYASALDAVLIILGAGSFARIVHTPDMEILASAPIPARIVVAAQAIRFAASLSALFLALGIPIVALVAAPLSLGVAGFAACACIITTIALAPLSVGLLLGVILLRAIPAAHARGAIALLAPTIGSLFVLVSHLIAHLSSRGTVGVAGTVGSVAAAVARAWGVSPFTWDGRALAAVFAHHMASAVLYAGGDLLVAACTGLLGWALARDLFAAGWAAYTEQPGEGRRRVRHGAATATGATPDAAAVVALMAVAPLPMAAARGVPWRVLVGREWRLARRDGIARGRALTAICPLLVAIGTALSAAVLLSEHRGRALARLLGAVPHLQAAALGATIYDVAVLMSCGGLMVALVDAAWAREMPSLDVLASAPLSSATIVGALGLAYAAPVALLAALCVAGGALALPLPVAAPILSCAIIASGLAMLSCLSILANALWPARGRPAELVPQTLRARIALGVADLAVSLWSGLFIAVALALLTLRHPALAVACAMIAVVVAVVIVLLAVRTASRALDRLYTNS